MSPISGGSRIVHSGSDIAEGGKAEMFRGCGKVSNETGTARTVAGMAAPRENAGLAPDHTNRGVAVPQLLGEIINCWLVRSGLGETLSNNVPGISTTVSKAIDVVVTFPEGGFGLTSMSGPGLANIQAEVSLRLR